MGFFSKARAAAIEQRNASRAKVTDTPAPVLAAEVEVIVVGQEYYKGMSPVSQGPVRGVTVRPDPQNKYDKHAVAVYVAGVKTGYLSKSRAQKYRPLISKPTSVEAHARLDPSGLNLFVMLPKLRK